MRAMHACMHALVHAYVHSQLSLTHTSPTHTHPSHIRFDPPLSSSKLKAIERVGVGAFVKVALLFHTNWWKEQWGASTVYYNVSVCACVCVRVCG